MKFEIERDEQGFAHAIVEDGKIIIHLNTGTVRNEENIERVVYLLNVAHGALYNPDLERKASDALFAATSKDLARAALKEARKKE